jgi:hypothetical protein
MRVAERPLRDCVSVHASGAMATSMRCGVRMGAPAWAPFPWRWGYGDSWPRGYDANNEE